MSPSMNDAPPAPKLPPELFRPIMDNLTAHSDRHTLCNAALSSKLLSAESQRVLFRTTTFTDSFWERNSLWRHITFLSAIISAPTRLGPLVHSYTQRNLAMDPNVESAFLAAVVKENPQAVRLWDLTMLGLPVMSNLKHLHFSTRNISSESILGVLTQCTFELISLSWTPPRRHIDKAIEDLLRTRMQLVHLDLSDFSAREPIRRSAVCPSLLSIRATHGTWAALCAQERRCIRALDVVIQDAAPAGAIPWDEIDEDMRRGLALHADRIRALSYSSYANLCSEFGGMPLQNLVLLRLFTYKTVDLLSISAFDSMRVLVLHIFIRESPSEGVVSSHLSFVFRRNVNVRYVDVQTEHTDVFQRYYRPTADAIDQRPTVKLFRANRAHGLWWECHLDEADYGVQDICDEATVDPQEHNIIQDMSSLRL